MAYVEPVYGKDKTGLQRIIAGAAFDGNLSSLGIDVSKDWNTKQIKNLLDPTLDQDAATKKYVDDNIGAGAKALFAGGSAATLNTGATQYASLMGTMTPSATEYLAHTLVPFAGTLKNLYVQLNGAPGAGNTYTFTIREGVPEADTTITCTISEPDYEANDLVNTHAVVAGDRITIKIVPASTPTARVGHWALEIEPS